jgi:dTDP-glucose 4,6-dehydratase
MNARKKVLITGSGSFIMGNLIRRAIYEKQNYDFCSIDKVSKTSVLNNIYSNKNHQFYIGDVTDSHILDVIFEIEKPSIVIHGAAETPVYNNSDSNERFLKNISATESIAAACVKWGVEKLIYTSTDKVYGGMELNSSGLWTEESLPEPGTIFAAAKLSGEHIVQATSAEHGLKYIITRSSNVYGPRQTSEKLIPSIIKNVLRCSKYPIYDTGMQTRTWTHVFDNCSALLTILNSNLDNTIVNISSGQEFSNIEVAHEVCKEMKVGDDLIDFVGSPQKRAQRRALSSAKLRALEWAPDFKFKSGISQTVEWYMNNKWFLDL